MENLKFYLYSAACFLAFTAGAALVYSNYYLAASPIILGSIAFYKLLKQREGYTGRTDKVKLTLSLIESLREIMILGTILTLPMVPKLIAVSTLVGYGVQRVFGLSLENKLQSDIYHFIEPSWRIMILGAVVGLAWYNSFIFYWAAWSFFGLYLLELLNLFKQFFYS